VPKEQLFADEHQLKLLKDSAIFADSERVRFHSLKTLAAFGQDAVPYVSEVLESSNDIGFKRYCIELLDKIKANHTTGMLGAVFAMAPYVVFQSCPSGFVSS
jgi:hypothetical protein